MIFKVWRLWEFLKIDEKSMKNHSGLVCFGSSESHRVSDPILAPFWLHFGSTLAPFWASWALRGRFIGVKKSPQRVSPCQVASWKGFGRHLGAILEALEGILVALGGQNRSHYGSWRLLEALGHASTCLEALEKS